MYYPTKKLFKRVRWHLRRTRAAQRWGRAHLRAAPAVLGNAMPKSGSHLLIQVLEGLTRLGPFVNPGFPPVNRSEGNRTLPEAQILAEVRAMQPGDIRYGYLHAREPWLPAVTGAGRATIFVYRDPRDWVVSQVFYATEMHAGHMLHAYYNALPNVEARINAAIEGVKPGATARVFSAPGVVERYNHYIGWLDVPGVLCVRFEDLILDQETTLGRVLDYLETFGFQPASPRPAAIHTLAQGIAPKKSGTFRKGKPGNWREHFTEANLERFNTVAGALVELLGYPAHRTGEARPRFRDG